MVGGGAQLEPVSHAQSVRRARKEIVVVVVVVAIVIVFFPYLVSSRFAAGFRTQM